MRTVGLVLLGLIGGLLFGIVAQDVIARALVHPPEQPSTSAAVALGALLPVCVIGGPVVAIVLDRRRNRNEEDESA